MTLITRETGPQSSPTALLLHGAGVTGWTWREVTSHLPGRHVLAPDLPGLGQNASLGPFQITRAAEHLAGFIRDRAHEGRAHIVGHSLGGAVAAQLAAAHPEVIQSVTLIGVCAQPLPFTRALITLGTALVPLQPRLAVLQGRTLKLSPAEQALLVRDARALTRNTMRQVLTEGAQFRVPRGLAELGRPLLVLAGLREASVVRESALALAATAADSGAYGIPDGDHAWFARRPDLLAQVLERWWAGEVLPQELVPLRRQAQQLKAGPAAVLEQPVPSRSRFTR
ncbi:alpha/beta fold hydrolase [Deinococcus hopiensis]|uniref:Pimeloyl-ACP methyl ester carboxylesterase n=1 Tax=Deinococcus hopiensis KR-140 TaxID=695939 RepID=A0A1W1UZ82_9DEIO|nr:alpha/beta fold hydrolase [Deinococcus hopiensis]SMB86024.1 Pimeloyl-ACP methyl ester carboxylesterase [Deinococcus hopiensis KR-140]